MSRRFKFMKKMRNLFINLLLCVSCRTIFPFPKAGRIFFVQ